MSLDHIAYYIPTAEFDKEVSFLLASLKHLGIVELVRIPGIQHLVGIGKGEKAFLWVSGVNQGADIAGGTTIPTMHFAIAATGMSA